MYVLKIEHDDCADDYLLVDDESKVPGKEEIKEKLIEYMRDDMDMNHSISRLIKWLRDKYDCNPYWFDYNDAETIYDGDIYDALEESEG